MQNLRAILVYLLILTAILAALLTAALLGWPWLVAAAMWPAENAVRLYERATAHGLTAWVQHGSHVNWYPWSAWWRHGPSYRVHELLAHGAHQNRVLAVVLVEAAMVAGGAGADREQAVATAAAGARTGSGADDGTRHWADAQSLSRTRREGGADSRVDAPG